MPPPPEPTKLTEDSRREYRGTPSPSRPTECTTALGYSANGKITSPPSTSPKPCCEGGQPIATDPSTGHTICSCQCSSGLLYSRLPGLSDSLYSHGPLTSPSPYSTPFPADPRALYQARTSGCGMSEGGNVSEAWRALYRPLTAYPYDSTMTTAYPDIRSILCGGFEPTDINAARRKNATRESTSTLKAWLQEHIKNPYPTKGEKIMLAIITKMTLTQVSTWFANARRRLKKENKMTWSPRNRCDDDDDDAGPDSDIDPTDDVTEMKSRDTDSPLLSPGIPPVAKHEAVPSTSSSEQQQTERQTNEKDKADIKPKIWSLAETATSRSAWDRPVSPPRRCYSPVLRFQPYMIDRYMASMQRQPQTGLLGPGVSVPLSVPYRMTPFVRPPTGFEVPLTLSTLPDRNAKQVRLSTNPEAKDALLEARQKVLALMPHPPRDHQYSPRPSSLRNAEHSEAQLSR